MPQGQLILEDCSITARSGTALYVHGSSADPLLRRCVIQDGQGTGLTFAEGARGQVEECTITGQKTITGQEHASVKLESRANPTFRGCKVRKGPEIALSVTNAHGDFEDCEFADHEMGLALVNSNPTLRNCKILSHKKVGLLAMENSLGTFEKCEFRDNTAAIQIKKAASPNFYKCVIQDNKEVGVVVFSAGRGVFQECDIQDCVNGQGIVITEESNPIFRLCKVRGIRVASASSRRETGCSSTARSDPTAKEYSWVRATRSSATLASLVTAMRIKPS